MKSDFKASKLNTFKFFRKKWLFPVIIGIYFLTKIYQSWIIIYYNDWSYFISKFFEIWTSFLFPFVFWCITAYWYRQFDVLFLQKEQSHRDQKSLHNLFHKLGIVNDEPSENNTNKPTGLDLLYNHSMKMFNSKIIFIIGIFLGFLYIADGFIVNFDVNIILSKWGFSPFESSLTILNQVFMSIFLNGPLATVLAFVLLFHIQFVRSLSHLESDFKIRDQLAISNLKNFLLESSHRVDISLDAFDSIAKYSIREFRENAKPITNYSMKISLLAVVGVAIPNIYTIINITQFVTDYFLIYILGNVLIFAMIFYGFLYPQISIHKIISSEKKSLKSKLEGIYQMKMKQYFQIISSKEIESIDHSKLITEINQIDIQIEKLDSLLTWPFNYKQLFVLLTGIVMSTITYIISYFLEKSV